MGEIDYTALFKVPAGHLARAPGVQFWGDHTLQLYLLDRFLSVEECDAVAEIARRKLRPSTLTVPAENFRTSKTCDLATMLDSLVVTIDARISTTIGIPLLYSEPIQAQLYDKGDEFKPHTDFFKPNEYEANAVEKGNRTWTFMVYLTDTPRGGATQFLQVKPHRAFQPTKGTALVWNNLDDEGRPNPRTLHRGAPVEEGEKVIITKWFRERGAGPPFLDAALAAAVPSRRFRAP